jgi:hypothetical protein
MGLTRWWELGVYLQSSLEGDGSYHYAGIKLRTKFILARPPHDRLRLGLNIEVGRLPAAYDADRWGAEVRPIVGWSAAGGRLFFAANPNLDFSLAGSDGRPSFEPALTALLVFEGLLSFGIEHYAGYGRPFDWAPLSRQEHYLYQVVNVLAWGRLDLNAGIGQGLTAASNDFVAKVILGFSQ